MALAFKRLVPGVLLGATASVVYPADLTVSSQLDAVTLSNVSGVDVSVSLWTPSGGGPGDANLVLKDFSVTAGQTLEAYQMRGHVLEAGMEIYGVASTAGVVSLSVSGRTKTV